MPNIRKMSVSFSWPPPIYLAFQIFTPSPSSVDMNNVFPPQPDISSTVANIAQNIGVLGTKNSNTNRRLGFILGLIALDHTDAEATSLINQGFTVAKQTGVAVGFHIDDQMFWGRLESQLNVPQNIEWTDWLGTLNTGRRLDWSATPTKVHPQLCLNSSGVLAAVSSRATLLGQAISQGLQTLRNDDLYLGVIVGNESQIGRDFDTGKRCGYLALTNAGYTSSNSVSTTDTACGTIITSFIDYWARSIISAGAPRDKVYSHIAFKSTTQYLSSGSSETYLQFNNFTPPSVAFAQNCRAGFSSYPGLGVTDQWRQELNNRGNPPWASSEGLSMDPPGEFSVNMEGYLGNLFNFGAKVVNLYGWGLGGVANPFRLIAEESSDSIAAYQKFLNGLQLSNALTYIFPATGFVAGSPGTPPLSWATVPNGPTQTISDGGTVNGMATCNIRFNGTPVSIPTIALPQQVYVSTPGQKINCALNLAMIAGSMTNINNIVAVANDGANNYSFVDGLGSSAINLTSSLTTFNYSTVTPTSTSKFFLLINVTGGGPIDITLQFGSQLFT